jgi:hypothetical protein
MDGKGAWRDNVFVERLWRSVKYEEVYLRAYDSVGGARASIGRYLDSDAGSSLLRLSTAGRGSMNFAVVFGASLWSGYALPACHPEKGIPDSNRQRFHLSSAKTCPDEAGHLSAQRRQYTRPVSWMIV